MSKGGGDTVTTTQKGWTAPLDWQQPFINYGLRRAEENLAKADPDLFPALQNALLQGAPVDSGNLKSSLGKFGDMLDSTDVNQMLKGLSKFATSNPLQDAAVKSIGAGNISDAWGTLSDIASGSFLNSNPYIDALYEQASRNVGQQFRDYSVPQTDAAFARAGRAGSGSYALLRNDMDETLGTTLEDLATDIYGQNYANERGLMQQAAGLLGTTGTSAIGNAQANRLNAQQYLSDFGMNAANQLFSGDLARLNYGLNALRTAGDPLSDYFARVGNLYGRQSYGENIQPNPNKRGFGDILGSVGGLALGLGSLGTGTIGGGLLSGLFGGGGAGGSVPMFTGNAGSFGGGTNAYGLGFGSPSFAF